MTAYENWSTIFVNGSIYKRWSLRVNSGTTIISCM